MNVGKRIKERRIALNMSVDELALKLNKDRSTIYRYESNEIEKLPTLILEPLAKILETTPGYLMGWNDDNFSKTDSENPSIFQKYNRLNDIDKVKTEAYVDGLLENDIYKDTQAKVITFSNANNNSNIKIPAKEKLIAQDTIHKTVIKPKDIN